MKKNSTCSKIKSDLPRSPCPITSTLDIIGDKWTLIIVRDMLFLNKRFFNEFLESPEGIATNILTERLSRLEAYGLIVKQPLTPSSTRQAYALTTRGQDLKKILIELIAWGNTHIEGTVVPGKENKT